MLSNTAAANKVKAVVGRDSGDKENTRGLFDAIGLSGLETCERVLLIARIVERPYRYTEQTSRGNRKQGY